MVGETTASLDFFFEFKKRFVNFCKSAPIYLDMDFSSDSVGVKNLMTEEFKLWPFDTSISVVRNIKRIRDWMYEIWYPYLEEEIFEVSTPSTAEILRRSRAGESTDELLTETVEVIRTVRWVIERVNDKNEIVLSNNDAPWRQSIWEMRAPSINFIKRLIQKELSPADGWLELHETSIARHLYDFDKQAKRTQDETISSDSD
jgi:hypothetical protein